MTNYATLSFNDMIVDLQARLDNLEETKAFFHQTQRILEESGYWERVDDDFQILVDDSIKYFSTAIKDIHDLINEMDNEVKTHHISVVKNLYKVAEELHKSYKIVWKQKYLDKDYGHPQFKLVEQLYSNGRSMSGDMISLSSFAVRLEDYLGRQKILPEKGEGLIDIFEIKPNIAGIGLNVNQIFKRYGSKMKISFKFILAILIVGGALFYSLYIEEGSEQPLPIHSEPSKESAPMGEISLAEKPTPSNSEDKSLVRQPEEIKQYREFQINKYVKEYNDQLIFGIKDVRLEYKTVIVDFYVENDSMKNVDVYTHQIYLSDESMIQIQTSSMTRDFLEIKPGRKGEGKVRFEIAKENLLGKYSIDASYHHLDPSTANERNFSIPFELK